MGRKNRVRHGQFNTDQPADVVVANVVSAADEAGATGTETLDAGSEGAVAAKEPETLADSGTETDHGPEQDPAFETDAAAVSTETPEMIDGEAQETSGGGGQDPAAWCGSGAGVGVIEQYSAAAGNAGGDPAARASGHGVAGVSGGAGRGTEGGSAANNALSEPIPSARAWRPHTPVEKAGMTAAASMNEAFWALVNPSDVFDDSLDRLHSNYTLWRPAADFVVANRDAPAESIANHLALKKIGGTMSPDQVEKTLWGVFKTVFLLVHDALVEAEAAAQADRPADPAPVWPGELAMQPQPGAFDAVGFAPRR